MTKNIIVQKYGGATVADPQKIKEVAQRIFSEYQKNSRLIIVVSAMGKTTNELIHLSQQVSSHPNRRELDMLLTVGERISMSLLSMALNDLGCPAISFTGSQAGILTDESHVNAFIQDVRPQRVEEALTQNKIVILAGFQGVSPVTKEITTLGRGGSDTSAVAMAAAFKAERCEILKDVPSIFSADPKIVKQALPITHLSYDQLLDMTFWGAKVLHYRSVEIAKLKNVPLYIGPAHSQNKTNFKGTIITKEKPMFEAKKILSINSHEQILHISFSTNNSADAIGTLMNFLDKKEIAAPQILEIEKHQNSTELYLTAPSEVIAAIKKDISNETQMKVSPASISSVTLTVAGVTSPELSQKIVQNLQGKNITFSKLIFSAMSISVFLDANKREAAILSLHELI